MYDFHEGDMAEELAEREYISLTVAEALQMARATVRNKWLERAVNSPQDVREAYNDMIGVERNEV